MSESLAIASSGYTQELEAIFASLRLVEAERDRRAGGRFKTIFPDDGPLRRELYPRHLEFFALGATKKERLFMAANRVGKTRGAAYEVTCHLTGRYPPWWTGKRFYTPIEAWAVGTTAETTRNIVQVELLGPVDVMTGNYQVGAGMIPADAIVHTSRRSHGLAGSVESIWVRHVSGGTSVISLKTYEQGREAFEGTAKHVIWCDEEVPADIYSECLYRTPTVRGITILTFTPLKGRTAVVNGFMTPPTQDAREFKAYVMAGWDHVPHLDPEERRALLATTEPHLIDARTKGIPSLGSGAIWPIPEKDIKIAPFELPPHFRRGFAADHGWNNFGAIWMAYDPETEKRYIYDCYKAHTQPPSVHAAAVKLQSRISWADPSWNMPGVMDSADINKDDGRQYLEIYRDDYGLNIELPNKAVETGLTEVWNLLSTGRLLVFSNLEKWFDEFRQYHRDDKGRVVKENDHLMDPTRYAVRMNVTTRMEIPPRANALPNTGFVLSGPAAWMA